MLSRPRLSVAAEERTSLDSICARWPQPCGGRGGRKAWLSRTRERDKENGDEHGNLAQSPAEVCERMEEMEKRSSRRIRTLLALFAGRGMGSYQIGCARISMMARSTALQSEAGYIDARPQILF